MNADIATAEEEGRITRFAADLRDKGRRPGTVGAYQCDWQKLATWSNAVNVEPFDLANMVGREAAELKEHLLKQHQAAANINRLLVFLTEYARWAVANDDGVRPSFIKELAAVTKVAQQPLAPRGLTKSELRRYLKEVDVRGSLRDRTIVYLMLHTGLRLGEVARLNIDDIEITERRGIVHVRGEWAKGSKERLVPIPKIARELLAEYLRSREYDDTETVFVGQRGPLGRGGVSGAIRRYARTADVKLSPHTLRHCFAYRYLETTQNDLVGLAAILGHSSLNTTMGYTRRRLDDLVESVEQLSFG